MAKIDLKSAIKKAAQTEQPNRFEKASATLEIRPTGYADAPPLPHVESTTTLAQPAAATTIEADPADLAHTLAPVESSLLIPSTLLSSTSTLKPVNTVAVETSSISWRLSTPRYEEVPLSLVDENPYNARAVYQPEKIANLAQSLLADGQLVPGIAVARGERRTLVAAHYRKRALHLAGISTIKLMVYDNLSDKDLYLLSYKENNEHSQQTPMDNAIAWKRLLDDGVYKSDLAIAEAIGMSRGNMSKTLAILKLDRTVLDVIEQDPTAFSLGALYELTLLQKESNAQLTTEFASRIITEQIGRKEIMDARTKIVEETNKKASTKAAYEVGSIFHIYNDTIRVGDVKYWTNGRVSFDVTITDPHERQRLLDDLRARFELKERTPLQQHVHQTEGISEE